MCSRQKLFASLIAVPAWVGNYNIELNADSWRGIGRTFQAGTRFV